MNSQPQLPTSISIQSPNEGIMSTQAATFLDVAKQLVVFDHGTMESASKYLKENKAEQKRLDAERVDLVDPLNTVVKRINGMYKPVLDVLGQAETIVKRAIGTYQQEEERKAREAAAIAEAAARKEREKLIAKAEKLEDKGQSEKAQALVDQAASTVAVIPQSAPAKVSGVSTSRVWKAEVVDVVALCREIAEGRLPPTLVDFKAAELNRIASTWQNTKEIPGLRIFSDVRVSSR